MICDVYLALGSNVGNREGNLLDAIKMISELSGTSLKAVSNIYETDPVGYTEQEKFLNMAVSIKTGLEPVKLLKELQGIETNLKRVREIHWGPRTIDIDILLYGDSEVNLPELTIPHPRMFERAFVLVPFKDVCTSGKIKGEGIDDLISKCSDWGGIKLYKRIDKDVLER